MTRETDTAPDSAPLETPSTEANAATQPALQETGVEAFDSLGRFLEEDGWFPQRLPLEDGYVYRVSFQGKNGLTPCYAQVRPELSQFLFYVIAPVKADPDRSATLCEFIARANYGLRIGNFELNMDNGDIRYKSSLDFEGTTLMPALIRGAIYPAVQTMDDYLPGILSVLFGGVSAKEAIEAIET